MGTYKSRLVWAGFEAKNKVTQRKLWKRGPQSFNYAYETFRPTINGHKFMTMPEVNEVIAQKIKDNEPFWAGRMGWTEMDVLRQVIQHDMIPALDHRISRVKDLYNFSGFFPIDAEYGSKFGHLILEQAGEIDMQGFWDLYMEDYMLYAYQKNTKYITTLNTLEPWNLHFENNNPKGVKPWSHALKGKKVLVVHPFAETLQKQYENNREKIFSRIYEADDILPEFDLKIVKAIQTLGSTSDPRFKTWFDAYDYMVNECSKQDFDVAILGCGAYGYPIAGELKKMGKTVIHMGGATQLMFGIVGRRWETTHIGIKENIMNEYWVRPREDEKPNKDGMLEQGCYW